MSGKVVQGFFDILRKTFLVPRLIGVFPVTGLLNRNRKLSRCSWLSPYTLYYVITVLSLIGCTIVHFFDAITTTRKYKEYGGIMVNCIVSVSIIFYLRLSMSWRNMLNKIHELEKLMPPLKDSDVANKNINRFIIFVVISCLVEYGIYSISTVRVLYLCKQKIHKELTVEAYYDVYFGWYIDILSFNSFSAIYLQILKFQTAIIFYYIDALICSVSIYLIYRFKNFNRLMKLKIKKCNQNTRWSDIQAHNSRLTRLVKVIDDNFNPFVLVSFLSSLIFICKMLYDFIQRQKNFTDIANSSDCGIYSSTDVISIIQSVSAVTFRLSRALSVSVLGSYIHSLSREPLNALHSLPSSAYNMEFQRFIDQVYYSKICLSGLQYFYVTRGTILSMVSTIITYELVLLQLPLLY